MIKTGHAPVNESISRLTAKKVNFEASTPDQNPFSAFTNLELVQSVDSPSFKWLQSKGATAKLIDFFSDPDKLGFSEDKVIKKDDNNYLIRYRKKPNPNGVYRITYALGKANGQKVMLIGDGKDKDFINMYNEAN